MSDHDHIDEEFARIAATQGMKDMASLLGAFFHQAIEEGFTRDEAFELTLAELSALAPE